jgi:N-acetylglucosamine-6-phosphate deacetylase
VQVVNGCALREGVLAGSLLTLDRALANFVAFTGATIDEGLRLLTANPAALIGLGEKAGCVGAGRVANLVAVNAEGKLIASIVHGVAVPGAPA